jgi:drug/metabolite transporter (DMT)-like permease
MLLWLPAALGSSVMTAANAELNRRHQQEGFRLNFWRTLMAMLVWAPLALVQPWPADVGFYAAAVFGGLSMILGNLICNHLSARHNGRVAILYMPVKTMLVFVAWGVVDPLARSHLMERPLATLAVLLCFAIMVIALNAMRRNDASLKVLKLVLPVAVLYGFSDLFSRLVVTPDSLASRLEIYFFIASTVSAGVSLLLFPFRPEREKPWLSRPLLKAGALAAFQSVINQACFFVALVLGPNPAYVSMVVLLAPLWLMGYHRLRGVPDDASPVAGMILAIAAMMLLAVTL